MDQGDGAALEKMPGLGFDLNTRACSNRQSNVDDLVRCSDEMYKEKISLFTSVFREAVVILIVCKKTTVKKYRYHFKIKCSFSMKIRQETNDLAAKW